MEPPPEPLAQDQPALSGAEGATPSAGDPGARAAKVGQAIHEWRNQLVDLGGRNSLLHYHDLTRGTLDLRTATPDLWTKEPMSWAPAEALLRGIQLRLSGIFREPAALADAARRCRVMAAKARENYEERGLSTLYLVFQMASWKDPRVGLSPPLAPVLLRPLALRPKGGGAEDFELVPEGPFELNPTLRQNLELDFALVLPSDEELGLSQEAGSVAQLSKTLAELLRLAAEVPGFQVLDRLVVGNFSYAKLPMVRDLENAAEAFAAHELIAAIANDDSALADLREHQSSLAPTPPDEIPPQSEFLVLDADASQSAVIDAVLKGSNLVVEGPPGTGKSQTIANLIAALAASGRTALFVAEKRAAIDAVLRRLDGVDLKDLVLDLHSRDGSRKQLAQDLARSLDTVRATARPQAESNQRALLQTRQQLSQYVRELHRLQQPWGLSVYQLQADVVSGSSMAESSLRLSRDALDQLHGSALQEAVEELHTYLELGGVRLPGSGDPWASALEAETIVTTSAADRARELISDLLNQHGKLLVSELRRTALGAGFAPGANTTEWRHRLDICAQIAEACSRLGGEVFSAPIDQLLRNLEPGCHGLLSEVSARWFNSGYRTAKRTASGLIRDAAQLSTTQLAAQLVAARDLLEAWRRVALGDSPPPLSAVGGDLRVRLEVADSAIHELAQLAALPTLAELQVGDWAGPVLALFEARESLAALPDLLRLRRSLEGRGLLPLLESFEGHDPVWRHAYGRFRYVWAISLLERISG